MNRCHKSALDIEIIMQHFCHRSQAIGRARAYGNDMMLGGIVFVEINSLDERTVMIFGGRGDQDFFGAGVNMFAGFFFVSKEAGAFEHAAA